MGVLPEHADRFYPYIMIDDSRASYPKRFGRVPSPRTIDRDLQADMSTTGRPFSSGEMSQTRVTHSRTMTSVSFAAKDLPPVPCDYHVDDDGNIVSLDPNLTTDGEALYHFIMSKIAEPPSVIIECDAQHTEVHTRVNTREENGHQVDTPETYSANVQSFRFQLDLSQYILTDPSSSKPPIFIVGDKEPAYRGSIVREVQEPPLGGPSNRRSWAAYLAEDVEKGLNEPIGAIRRKASAMEIATAKDKKLVREEAGLPPWTLMPKEENGMAACLETTEARSRVLYGTYSALEGFQDGDLPVSSMTLRNWCDEYCRSPKTVKEFVFHKEVYGWNLEGIRDAVWEAIRTNHLFASEPIVKLKIRGSKITIKSDSELSRILSNRPYYILLWIFLIYPLVIWPFLRYHSRGGGKWIVAGCAYPFAKWVDMENSVPGETAEEYSQRCPPQSLTPDWSGFPSRIELKTTPRGVSQLVGLREEDWLAMWKDTISNLVRTRHVDDEPIKSPTRPADPQSTLGHESYLFSPPPVSIEITPAT